MHAWTIHPFTTCSLPLSNEDESELVFFIRPRGGFTARLAHYAETHLNSKIIVLLDGPYGGVDMSNIEYSQRMLVIAGGSGAGWLLPFIQAFLKKSAMTRHKSDGPPLKVVLATRDVPTKAWFEDEVSHIMSQILTDETLAIEIEVYHTGPSDAVGMEIPNGQFWKELKKEKAPDVEHTTISTLSGSTSSSQEEKTMSPQFQYWSSRPHLPAMIRDEALLREKDQTLGVFVCGPLSIQSDVSNAVAKEQLRIVKTGEAGIYLHMEHFSWA